MTEAEQKKLNTIRENVPKVYEAGIEAGEKSEYDAFWDAYQEYGLRTYYEAAFSGGKSTTYCGWTDENFKPKYDIILEEGYSGRMMFWNNCISDVPATLERQGVVLDTTRCNVFEQAFQHSRSERWGVINMVNSTNSRYAFGQTRCKTIEKLIVSENTPFTAAFNDASYLSNLTIEGTIGQNGLNVSWSPLTHDSLMSIINALQDKTTDTSGTEWLVTIGSTNKAKLTEDELYIAESKGWRVA